MLESKEGLLSKWLGETAWTPSLHPSNLNVNKQKQESKDNLIFILRLSHRGREKQSKSSEGISFREQNKSKLCFLIQNICKIAEAIIKTCCADILWEKK